MTYLIIYCLNCIRCDENSTSKGHFKRPILHVPNAIQTIHNEKAYLIIYCLNCIRCMQNSTFEMGLNQALECLKNTALSCNSFILHKFINCLVLLTCDTCWSYKLITYTNTRKILYCALVRRKLEYACSVWSPYTIKPR